MHRKALALRRPLAYEPGAVGAEKLDLARSLLATGWLERSTGDNDAARTSGEEARDLAKEVGTQGGETETEQDVLTAAYQLIALVLSETGDLEGAIEGYRHALAIRQKFADARPGDIQAQTKLADSLREIGNFLVRFGRPRESIDYFDRGEEVWIKVADTQPAVANFRHNLANWQINTATVLLRLGRTAEARARYQRAVGQCEMLMSAQPNAQASRLTLAKALLRLGQACQAEADFAAAAADWRRAIALLDAVSVPVGELVFVNAGCHASVASLAARAESVVSSSERDAEIDAAIALLRQAVSLGYRNPESYRTEDALGPLRGRDEFRLLMMDLAMPADPLAGER